jgi:phage-related protein
MIVNLPSIQIVQTEAFRREIAEFPFDTAENILYLVRRFARAERLGRKDLKVFKIGKNVKILEFRVRYPKGNWRAIATLRQGRFLVLVHVFHKKSQELQQKDKELILGRIQRISL